MRVHILTISYHPDQLGIAPLADDLSLALHERGHEVTVITGLPHYPSWRVPDEYRRTLWKTETRHGGVRVLRSYLHASESAGIVSKMAFYGSFTASSLVNILRSGRADVQLVISPPPTLVLGAWVKRLFGRSRIVLDVQDIVPDAAITLGVMRSRAQIAFFRWLERFAYRVSQRIVVVAPNFRPNLERKGVPPSKIDLVYNWVDTERLRPSPRQGAFRAAFDIPESTFLVLYAGNVGLSQGLDVVVRAAQRLSSERDLLFGIVGGGTTVADLRRQAEAAGLSNLRFFPVQDRFEDVQAAADVSLVMQKPNVLDINLPSKIPAIMATGRPIIAGVNPAGDAAAIVSESGAGRLIPPGDDAALAEAVRDLRADPAAREAMAGRGRAYAVEHFSREAAVDAYLEVLEAAARGVTPALNQRGLFRKTHV